VQSKQKSVTISTEEKSDVINLLEKSERIIDVWWNARIAYSSICKIHDNANRITASLLGWQWCHFLLASNTRRVTVDRVRHIMLDQKLLHIIYAKSR